MRNGRNYGWESVTIALPHGTLVAVSKIEYSDEKEFKPVYGKGGKPRAYGSGNYKAEGKLTLQREAFERLLECCQAQGIKEFYGLPPFPIVVSYANADRPLVTDVLQQCKFTKTASSADQGKEQIEVELDFVILGGVEWDALQAAILDAFSAVGSALK